MVTFQRFWSLGCMLFVLFVVLSGYPLVERGVVTARLVDPHYADYFVEVTYPDGRVELHVASSDFDDYQQGDPYP